MTDTSQIKTIDINKETEITIFEDGSVMIDKWSNTTKNFEKMFFSKEDFDKIIQGVTSK
jgi:hypothetical protein